jgi:Ca2+/Na+ antiporter
MKHIIGSLFFLIVLLCLSVFIFDPSKLYFELPWLDIPMHVLGGFGVASFVMAVATYGKQKLSIVHVLILYLCVAVTWELYELVKDVFASNVPWNGWSDTLSDTINGAVGAVVAFFIFKK